MRISITVIFTLAMLASVISNAYAQNSRQAEFKRFEEMPFLSYNLTEEKLILKVDYKSGWGYRVIRFKFPDRLVLDVSFKSGIPDELKKTKFPVYENIDLPSHYLLTDLKATLDEDGIRVTTSSIFPLEFDPVFDDDTGVLKVEIPLIYVSDKQIRTTKGIEYHEVVKADRAGPRKLHVLYVDTRNSNYVPKIMKARDFNEKLLKVESMSKYAGAFCAINGGFFSGDGNHQGLIIRNGRLESYPKFNRPVFARTTDGNLHIGYLPFHGVLYGSNGQKFAFDAVDTIPKPGETVLLTPGHPDRISKLMKGSKIVIRNNEVEQITTEDVNEKKWRYILWSPDYRDDFKRVQVGERIDLEFGLGIDDIEIETAIGAGPMLVIDGKISVSKDDEFLKDIMQGRAPRTGIGLTDDGRLVLIVLEGRNPLGMKGAASIGGTLEEFASIMIDYGAKIAMNLDGGGSSSMFLDGKTVTFYPGGSRAVSNAIGIFDKRNFDVRF